MNASLPKGTRDFLPSEVKKRNYIFDTIRHNFEKYGYVPIETPAFENLATLTGKYGEEGDRLLFKILNNGDFLSKVDDQALKDKNSSELTKSISKRGLKYDLTVPFARYVVMHQNDLYFPFKRYQIQPVWRADRPQKGRYQEFYQCDADVVGSDSLLYEAELLKIYDDVFAELGISVTIKLNNRKILYGLSEVFGIESHFVDMTVALDKLDKIGNEKVVIEMTKRGISESNAQSLIDFIENATFESVSEKLNLSETGALGVSEVSEVLAYLDLNPIKNTISFDITLARGLGYYTGCIMEVQANDIAFGSLGGGGRYADLTSNFGGKNLSGVGISFGAERIYDVMLQANAFPNHIENDLDLIFIGMTKEGLTKAFDIATQLRTIGLKCDIYPELSKMKKQMKYANERNVPFVAIIGEEELEKQVVSLKNMTTGEQQQLSIEEVVKKISNV